MMQSIDHELRASQNDPITIRIARITMQWNELHEIDAGAAKDLAKAFLSGALMLKKKPEEAQSWNGL